MALTKSWSCSPWMWSSAPFQLPRVSGHARLQDQARSLTQELDSISTFLSSTLSPYCIHCWPTSTSQIPLPFLLLKIHLFSFLASIKILPGLSPLDWAMKPFLYQHSLISYSLAFIWNLIFQYLTPLHSFTPFYFHSKYTLGHITCV